MDVYIVLQYSEYGYHTKVIFCNVPTNWDEFVAAAPALEKAGILPMAMGQQGWQQSGAFNVFMASLLPSEVFMSVYGDKDTAVAGGADVAKVFKAASDARAMAANSTVQNWNDATNLVITGKAGGQYFHCRQRL